LHSSLNRLREPEGDENRCFASPCGADRTSCIIAAVGEVLMELAPAVHMRDPSYWMVSLVGMIKADATSATQNCARQLLLR